MKNLILQATTEKDPDGYREWDLIIDGKKDQVYLRDGAVDRLLFFYEEYNITIYDEAA